LFLGFSLVGLPQNRQVQSAHHKGDTLNWRIPLNSFAKLQKNAYLPSTFCLKFALCGNAIGAFGKQSKIISTDFECCFAMIFFNLKRGAMRAS